MILGLVRPKPLRCMTLTFLSLIRQEYAQLGSAFGAWRAASTTTALSSVGCVKEWVARHAWRDGRSSRDGRWQLARHRAGVCDEGGACMRVDALSLWSKGKRERHPVQRRQTSGPRQGAPRTHTHPHAVVPVPNKTRDTSCEARRGLSECTAFSAPHLKDGATPPARPWLPLFRKGRRPSRASHGSSHARNMLHSCGKRSVRLRTLAMPAPANAVIVFTPAPPACMSRLKNAPSARSAVARQLKTGWHAVRAGRSRGKICVSNRRAPRARLCCHRRSPSFPPQT
jgi:hypothetical protein